MDYLKKAEVTPHTVLAGDSVEIIVKVTIGKNFITKNSRILLDLPGNMGYSRPTQGNPEDSGYIEVLCSNPDIYFQKRCWNMNTEAFETRQNLYGNKHAQRIFALDFLSGDLQEGDELTFLWGFAREGFGQGTKVSTLVLTPEFYNTIHVRYFINGEAALPDHARPYQGYERPVPDQEVALSYLILPREPQKMRLITGITAKRLLVLDRFSNLCRTDTLENLIDPVPKFTKNRMGVIEIQDCPDNLASVCGITLLKAPEPYCVYEDHSIYFGDMHTHCVFSYDCIEREKMTMAPNDYFNYARDASCIDFLAITDHHVPWGDERRKIGKAQWEMLQEAVNLYNEPGTFLAFAGFETKDPRGDTTFILGEPFAYDELNDPAMKDMQTLWERYKGRNYMGIPHFHNSGELPEGQWYQCPYEGVEPVIEISSCHGTYEAIGPSELQPPLMESLRKDRCGRWLLNQGYKYGFVCNSDGHKGNPGKNGLLAVYAKELTKEAILEGIRKRRTYGTTNARIRLLYTINGLLMGSTIPAKEKKEIYISVAGEDILQVVDVISNDNIVKRFYPRALSFTTSFHLEDITEGYCYIRVIQQDGQRAYSSAIWFQ